MTDPVGLEMLHRIGAETGDVVLRLPAPGKHLRLHPQRHRGGVRRRARVEDAQKILGKTALELFRMDD